MMITMMMTTPTMRIALLKFLLDFLAILPASSLGRLQPSFLATCDIKELGGKELKRRSREGRS